MSRRRNPEPGPGLKLCYRCDTIKPLDQFFADRGHWTGRQSRCKACDAERQNPKLRHRASEAAE